MAVNDLSPLPPLKGAQRAASDPQSAGKSARYAQNASVASAATGAGIWPYTFRLTWTQDTPTRK